MSVAVNVGMTAEYLSDDGVDSSGEGVEIVPYNYSTDSTVSMDTTEDSHDVISDSPIAGRSLSSNYHHHVAFGFLDKQEDIKEEDSEYLLEHEPPHQNGIKDSDGSMVIESGSGIVVGLESNGSTAEEVDTAPFDSGTTDPGGTVYGDEGIVGYTGISEIMTMNKRPSYENWSIIEENEEMTRKRKLLNRNKLSRVGVRQRAPQPLPRSSHLKQKMSRPQAPVPRKRRVLGRIRPSTRSLTSEGDMEQADEMGDDGEGDDDGFVDGSEAGLAAKKKTKKKLSILVPSLPVASPPSSPSNTPVSRRRSSSRKNRAKPKVRKNLKPTLASADISTQETTTPGPPTSDSDNKDINSIFDEGDIEDIIEEDMSIRGATAVTNTRRHSPTVNGTVGGLKKLEPNSRTPSVESISKKSRFQNGRTTGSSTATLKQTGNRKSVNEERKLPSDRSQEKVVTKSVQDSSVAEQRSSETSDTSDNGKKKKVTPPLGVSSSFKGSPQVTRKFSEQENQRPRQAKSSHQAGKFVSPRLSVAAMINQFDTGEKSVSPTSKNTSPVIRSPNYTTTKHTPGSPSAVASKKTPSLSNKASFSKPDLKPKATSPTGVGNTTKTSSESVKKDETVKPSQSTNSGLNAPNPPLPPKPRSPTASKHLQISTKGSNGASNRTSSTSTSSSSSLSSSSSSSVSKSKCEETTDKANKVKQPVIRKSSLVRAPSNSSSSGKSSNSASSKPSSKLPNTQRRPSPVQSSILPNKGVSSHSNIKSVIKTRTTGREKEVVKLKSASPPVVASEGSSKSSSSTTSLCNKDTSPVPTTNDKRTTTNNQLEKEESVNKSGKENTSDSDNEDDKHTVKQKQNTLKERKQSPCSNGDKTVSENKPLRSLSSIKASVNKPEKKSLSANVSALVDTSVGVQQSQPGGDNPSKTIKPSDTSVSPVKASLQPQKSSSRRPPPDPPVSPLPRVVSPIPKPISPVPKTISPISKTDNTNLLRRPRLRSPPPPPPMSPSKKKDTDSSTVSARDSECTSPRNYEEFVPSVFRSNSVLSTGPQSSPPPPMETNAKGDYSTTKHYSASAYEDIVIPVDNPTSSLPPGGFQRKSLSFSSVSSSHVDDTDMTYSECVPPPLPPRNYPLDDPVISLPSVLDPVDEHAGKKSSKVVLGRKKSKDPFSSEDDSGTPPPLPSQPIPRRKSFLGPSGSPLLKRKEIQVPPTVTATPSPPVRKKNMENVYEEIPGTFKNSKSSSLKSAHYESADNVKLRSIQSSRDSSPSDSIDGNSRRFSASVCVSTVSGLSPVTLRRANSDKMKNNPRVQVLLTPHDGFNSGTSLQRAPSMDILDDRMNQTVSSVNDSNYSSEDDSEGGTLSPTQGLPEPPKSKFLLDPQKDLAPNDFDEEHEPLYQHINHLDFTSTPWMSKNKKISDNNKQEVPKESNNQLEIARHLSVNHRKLWCEQPEVINSGLLQNLSDQKKKLQEAMFEVITSEASYLRSLDVLIDHFMDDPGMNPNLPPERRVLSKRQYQVIYSNIKEIRQVSANFLHELRARQKQSLIIDDISDIVSRYAEAEFGCYITYCTNQVYQMREITEMLYSNTMFIDFIRRLESHKRCQSLSITSFLLLPMQRITRLPLLILAILNRMSSDHEHHSNVEDTLRSVQKLVTACNDGARQMERTEELHQIHNQLNFGKLKPFPLVSISRRLERKGSLSLLEIEQRLFGKPRIRRIQVFLFAFTDYILITKRKKGPKGEISYKVIDYASKAVVEIEKLKISKSVAYPKHTFGEHETLTRATWVVSSANEPHSFLLILLDNSVQKVERYVLVCQNDTECTRWMESISHPAKEKQKEDETIYETWDCPQVQAIYDYTPQQHDELSLVRGDIVKVLRKMADGWYEGEKLRDLQWGWFPSNFAVEIENAHTRARNLKERHRLLSTQLDAQQFSQQFSLTTVK